MAPGCLKLTGTYFSLKSERINQLSGSIGLNKFGASRRKLWRLTTVKMLANMSFDCFPNGGSSKKGDADIPPDIQFNVHYFHGAAIGLAIIIIFQIRINTCVPYRV